MSRIDRKSLRRPDAFQREVRHVGRALAERWPLALGVVVLVAALVGGGAWWRDRAADREARAAAAVAAAIAQYQGSDPAAGGPTPESARAALPALREAAARFSGTDAGAMASLYVGHALLRSGDARGAEAAYQAAMAVAPNELAEAAARLGLGHARLAAGNAAGAVEAWTPLVEGDGPLRGVALLDLGRAYEALGQKEAARKAYADGTAALGGNGSAAGSRTVQLAGERLAALGGAPAPAASPPAR
ncbi:MAG TPA: tetratricopeptide repeat protein [Thermodesulfobacteriota bacterium]